MTQARPSWTLRTRIGLGVTVLCLAGPAVQPAAAEDGGPFPATSELADAAVESALETVSALSAAEPVEQAPAEALPPAPEPEDAVSAVIPPPDAVSTTEPLLPAPSPVSEAPPAAETPVAPVSTPEPVSPEPVPEADPAAAATQVQPLNVNVAVRVDSPGDNGAVEQVNAAVVEVVGTSPAPTAEQYQPATPQYQPPQATAAPAAPAPADPAPADEEPGWKWTWTCGGSVTDVLAGGGSAALLPANWNWNWEWNCGDEQAPLMNNDVESRGQYHPQVTQYQPLNLNVSIRIGSPGNDGPVTQTNVTSLSVVIVTPTVVVPPVVVSPLPIPLPAFPASAASSAPAAASESAPAAAARAALAWGLASVELTFSLVSADTTEWILQGGTGPFGIDPAAAAGDERGAVAARPPFAPKTGSPAGRLQRAALAPESSALALRAVAVVHAQTSVRTDRPARAKPKRNPLRRPAPPVRAPVLASGFAGATPGGADGGGWPLLALLLVPFSLALVDSSRRMARDATFPAAAEFFSRRERPG